jgi:AcrR family transcriptional regulator
VTTRQKQAGEASREATRRRLIDAAAQAFLEGGYTATTVSVLARRAGVSVQTLYLAVGGKPALLRAVLEQALRTPSSASSSASSGPIGDDYLRGLRAQAAEVHQGSDDPRTRIYAIAHVYRSVAERAAPWWRLYRNAAATEPEIAADWAELQRLRRDTLAALLLDLPDEELRPDLTRDYAIDTLWALASPETHDLLVERREYTLDRYQTWLTNTLAAALLP